MSFDLHDEYENGVVSCGFKLISGQNAFGLGLNEEMRAFYFYYPQTMRDINNDILCMHCGSSFI